MPYNLSNTLSSSQVGWKDEANPSQGFEDLYLSEQDYKSLPEGTVAASKTVVRPRPPSPPSHRLISPSRRLQNFPATMPCAHRASNRTETVGREQRVCRDERMKPRLPLLLFSLSHPPP